MSEAELLKRIEKLEREIQFLKLSADPGYADRLAVWVHQKRLGPTLLVYTDAAGLVVNEAAGDAQDFRCEGSQYNQLFLVDASDNSVLIGTTTAGNIAKFDETEILFNDTGLPGLDFRVEGDSYTQLFVVDAGENAVKIGSTTAGNSAMFNPTEIVFNDNASNLDFRVETDAGYDAIFVDAGANSIKIMNNAAVARIGFFDAVPVNQPDAVADATGASDVVAQLNLLLARMRELGLIAT